MAAWYCVALPALLVALAVRLDSILIGPYFSIASIVAGMVGFDDHDLQDAKTLKHAVWRRFFYPFLLGVTLALVGLTLQDTAASGFLAAGLLLWPAVFHPLPTYVSLRDWQVTVVWTAFFLSYGALAGLGWYLVEVVYSASGGAVVTYMRDVALGFVITAIGTAFFLAFFRGGFESLRARVNERQSRDHSRGTRDDEK